MGCTPSKKELEKQTGEKPGDHPDGREPQKNGRHKNGEIKKSNAEEVMAKAPITTLTPNGEGPKSNLTITSLDGLPSDIKFIDADEESLRKASQVDISAAAAVSGESEPATEDNDANAQDSGVLEDIKKRELEDRLAAMIDPETASPFLESQPPSGVAEDAEQPESAVVVQQTRSEVTTTTTDGEDGPVVTKETVTVVTTRTVTEGEDDIGKEC